MKFADLREVEPEQIFYMRCTEHRVDLDAIRRWSDELESLNVEELIRRGICPACPPWFIADGFPILDAMHRGSWLECDCCGTSWRTVADGWEALCGDGLLEEDDEADTEVRHIEPGMKLTSAQFEVDMINPVDASLDILFTAVQRSLFGNTQCLSDEQELTRDVIVFSLEQALWDMENADSIGEFVAEILSKLNMDSKKSARAQAYLLTTFLELRSILERVSDKIR